MISKDTYSIEYVNSLREKYKKDPSLLERVLFAFFMVPGTRFRKIVEIQD